MKYKISDENLSVRCKNENWHLYRSVVDIWFHHQLLGPVRLQPLHEHVLSSPGTTGICLEFLQIPPSFFDTVFRQTWAKSPTFLGNALVEGTYGTLVFIPDLGVHEVTGGFNVSIFKTNVWKIHFKNHPAFLESVHFLVWKIILYIKMKHCKNPWQNPSSPIQERWHKTQPNPQFCLILVIRKLWFSPPTTPPKNLEFTYLSCKVSLCHLQPWLEKFEMDGNCCTPQS